MAIPSSAMPRTTQMLEARQKIEDLTMAVEAGTLTTEEARKEETRYEKAEKGKKWRVNFWLLLVALLIIAVLTAVIDAIWQHGGLYWIFQVPQAIPFMGDIALVMAPLLAVSIAMERLLETVFDWYEQSVIAVSDIVSQVRKPVDWIQEELLQAYNAAKAVAKEASEIGDEASLRALDIAEQRLAKAEQRLLGWVKAPEYIAWKRALCIWVGLLVGLEVAVIGDLGMMRSIGITTPRLLDMIITGLVVGAGPGPMHLLIGILQGGKNALQNLADLAEGKAVREAAKALKDQTIT